MGEVKIKIILKNNDSYEGVIVEENNNSIKIRTSPSSILLINKKNLKRIERGLR